MARFQILSDLHLEHRPRLGEEIALREDVDAVLLAGDIASGTDAIAWISRRRPTREGWLACYLPGNHEPYGHTVERLAAEMASAAAAEGVALLAPGVRDVAGVRVIGATLWTNYMTSCRRAEREPDTAMARQSRFANICQRALNDFRWIRTGGRPITTGDVLAWHARDLAFIDAELGRAADEGMRAVVMTHHAPLRGSIAAPYDGDPVTAAFASDLDALVRRHRPAAWLHGHTHTGFAYRHAGCLVVCNPAGYTVHENPAFDPGLVLDVPTGHRPARLVPGP